MSVTVADLIRTGPATLAGRYLRSFWQPVVRSEDLPPGTALPVRIMSEDFTVYRGAGGAAHVVAGRCAHRRTRLHTGVVIDDTIRCLYHGWQYDATGQCIYQPAEREAFTRATHIAAYPTTEHLGLVWAYFGLGDAPPMNKHPDFERPGTISVGPPETWPCNVWNRFDNAPDLMHVVFTHQETMNRERGTSDMWKPIPEIHAVETEFGIETTVKGPAGVSSFHFLMPNTNAIAPRIGRVEGFRDAGPLWAYEMFVRVPVDDEHCRSFHVSLIDIHGEDARHYIEMRDRARAELDPDALIMSTAEAVLDGRMRISEMDPRLGSYYSFLVEDYACQVGQGPIADRENERLGSIDQGTLLLRKIWLRELAALADGRPLKAWVIPAGLADRTSSPARAAS
jgi:5,5'-dehydrodivanillate O-demethylase oxygenase subunit